MSFFENFFVALHLYGLHLEDKETEKEIKRIEEETEQKIKKIREERQKVQQSTVLNEKNRKK